MAQRIIPAVYGETVALSVSAYEVPGEPIGYAEAMSQTFAPFAVGTKWSRPWGTTWFKLDGEVPTDWAGRDYEVVVDLGFAPHSPGFQSEAAVWTPDGPRWSVHPQRTGVPVPDAVPGQALQVVLEAAANPGFAGTFPTPMGTRATSGDRPIYVLRRADLAIFNREVHALRLDIEVLYNTMLSLALDDPRRHKLLRALERSLDAIDLDDVAGTVSAARAKLAPALSVPARASAHHIVAVGHAHIDSAWLWPLRETVRKCARTFSSAVALMHEYPEYKFVCSQAVQYDWMERNYPNVFAGIKDRVQAGQWQPVGGMWVEADMNLPSGESIARQLIFGQRYFESRFGVRCKEVWIPDVFGYPGSLPQIFNAGGCDRFVTQKLSWNKQNRMPHNTFQWFGIDGSCVLTHFPPVDTYNATVDPAELSYAQANFADKGWSDWSLMPFGYGNGGGGPTREMLERARRTADLDGLPTVQIGTTDDYFERVEAEIVELGAPEWHGELYFEMHRGTLTTQVNTKLGNRTCERLLREAELWWTTLTEFDPTAEYPYEQLDEIWKEVLLQQFHDIIPGSSIAWVYEDTAEVYGRLVPQLEALVAGALDRLATIAPTVSNSATHARDEVVIVQSNHALRSSFAASDLVQELADGAVAMRVAAPGLGLGSASPISVDAETSVSVSGNTMSNGLVALTWDDNGCVTSIRDLVADRELLLPGRVGGDVELASDFPNEYDAWDLEHWARRSTTALRSADAVEIREVGPLRGSLAVTRSFGASRVEQRWLMRAGSSRIDIEFDIDWHEDEKLLSVAFPLAVHSDRVDCGIQNGSVSRPRHANTSWDAAKFEVCVHRWVDVSEPDFGVAILNNGRYGHAVQGDAIAVSLLRAPKWPDPLADRGRHMTTVSVFPHAGDRASVCVEAERLNEPLRVMNGTNAGPLPAPIVNVADRRIELAAVKRADDGSDDLVVRMYERTGAVATVDAIVNCAFVRSVGIASSERDATLSVTNLLEEKTDETQDSTRYRRHRVPAATDPLRPFELRTVRTVRTATRG